MSSPRLKKCPVKKAKQISITFGTVEIEPDYFKDLGIDDKLCHVTVEVFLKVKLSDIQKIFERNKTKLTQKDLKQFISNRI